MKICIICEGTLDDEMFKPHHSTCLYCERQQETPTDIIRAMADFANASIRKNNDIPDEFDVLKHPVDTLVKSFEVENTPEGGRRIKFTLHDKLSALKNLNLYQRYSEMDVPKLGPQAEQQLLFAFLLGKGLEREKDLGRALVGTACTFEHCWNDYQRASIGLLSQTKIGEYDVPPKTMIKWFADWCANDEKAAAKIYAEE